MGTKFHCSVSIDEALRNKAFECFKDGDGKSVPPKQMKKILLEMQQSGIGYFVESGCDNQGDDGRCLGHPIAD